jgi:predicted dehydrogenase
MDIGVHVLDLVIWWLGYPEEIAYEDDAMGGIEVNCSIRCRFPHGMTGQIRLSRDCDLANRYVIQGTKGWLSWQVNEANQVQMGFADAPFGLSARADVLASEHPLPVLGTPGFNFEQSFTSQITNVIAAIRGSESLVVSGEQGIQSLRLIEACYRQRGLMLMPWMGERELVRARQLSESIDSGRLWT